MKTVFIGGSRRITKLNKDITKKLDNFIEDGATILIGDANGADKTVQNYLSYKNYGNVIVFCMRDECRNNVGNWHVRSIETALKGKDFDYYAAKDLEMVKETDYAFMIWDTKSKGTLNNILNLVKGGKTVLVHLSPEKKSYKVASSTGLKKLLTKCDQRTSDKSEKTLKPQRTLRYPEANRFSNKSRNYVGTVRQAHLSAKKRIIVQGNLPLVIDAQKDVENPNPALL